jgi:hypothetical protein
MKLRLELFVLATMGCIFNWVLYLMCIAMPFGSDGVHLNFDFLHNFLMFLVELSLSSEGFFQAPLTNAKSVVQKKFGGCSNLTTVHSILGC